MTCRIITFVFLFVIMIGLVGSVQGGFITVAKNNQRMMAFVSTTATTTTTTTINVKDEVTALRMVDTNVITGVGIGVAGLVAGIGLVAFTEQQGERAKERGSGLSESMQTRIAGQLLEDVEVSSVDDLGSLTSQLENALKKSGGIQSPDQFEMTEAEKKKLQEAADDGW